MTINKKLEIASGGNEHADLSVLKSDIDTIKSDILKLTQHVKEEGMTETRYLKKKAIEQKDRVYDQIDHMQEMGSRKWDDVEERVRSKPSQSILIAFAAGFVVNFLFGSKN